MSATVSVAVDMRDISRFLDLSNKQVRYAAARALTDVAKLSQAHVVTSMPGRFTLRRDWIPKGIRISRATRKDLRAEVFSKDESMNRQEEGGDKTPRSGRHVAVPGPVLRPLGPSKDPTRIPAGQFPRAALTKPRTFLVTTKTGARVIMRRLAGKEPAKSWNLVTRSRKYGKGKMRLKREARIVYTLVGRAHVKPRLGMAKAVQMIVREEFRRRFEIRYIEAMATARVDGDGT